MQKITYLLLISCFFSIHCYSQDGAGMPDGRGYMIKLGDTAPDFTIKFADGSPSKKLSEFKGSVVMLQFTASWCSVCIKEMPHIQSQIWETFKSQGLYLFGVDRKENKEQVVKFANKMKIGYPLIMDEDGEIFKLFAHPDSGVTRNVIIDKKGKIVFLTRLYNETEFNEMLKKIEELLKS